MQYNYDICVSSPPDREKLVAEIFFGSFQWAEVNQESNELQIEFYPRPDSEPWRITFRDALAALEEARHRLEGD